MKREESKEKRGTKKKGGGRGGERKEKLTSDKRTKGHGRTYCVEEMTPATNVPCPNMSPVPFLFPTEESVQSWTDSILLRNGWDEKLKRGRRENEKVTAEIEDRQERLRVG